MVDGGDPDSSVFFFARGPREIACLVLDGPLTDHEPHVADMIIAEGWRELGKD
jgi:hypothetical protein